MVYFRIVFYDDDNMTFNISEITHDDTATINKTCELQTAGREVRISTTNPVKDISLVPSIASLINRGPSGYRYDKNLKW